VTTVRRMGERMRFDPLRLVLVSAMAGAATLGACVDASESGPAIDPALSRQLDADLATNVIIPTYQAFLDASGALEAATATYAGSLAAPDRDAAKAAFEAAMSVWQRAEVMQVGPLGISTNVKGGQDIRDEIYSWPLLNRCRVDQEIVEAHYVDVDAFAAEAANVRGLDAIEYLLYREDVSNACPEAADINAQGGWAALTDIDQRRADYAHALAVLVERQAQRLVDAWAPTGGNFLAELEAPGEGESPVYDDPQEAMNAITDAMFYVEFKTKDLKMPALDGSPVVVESDWAHMSLEEIRQNLIGFQQLFHGGTPGSDGNGFDDLLVTLGHGEFAAQVADEVEGAIAAVDQVEPPLETAAVNDAASVQTLYDDIRDLTTLLKNEFKSVLHIDLPIDVTGDID
jgi:predicted lipoprotein